MMTNARTVDPPLDDDIDWKNGGGNAREDVNGVEGGAQSEESFDEDDRELEALGYVPSFKREFSNLATVSRYIRFEQNRS